MNGERTEACSERGEVDAGARRDIQACEQVGLLRLTRGIQGVDRLLLGQPGWDLLADDAVEQDVRGVAEDLRADDRKRDAQDRERDDQADRGASGRSWPSEPPERALEVLRLLGRQADTAEWAATEPAPGRGRRAGAPAPRRPARPPPGPPPAPPLPAGPLMLLRPR